MRPSRNDPQLGRDLIRIARGKSECYFREVANMPRVPRGRAFQAPGSEPTFGQMQRTELLGIPLPGLGPLLRPRC